MALKTTLEQLEEVQAAITELLQGKTVIYQGYQVTHESLGALQSREDVLLRRHRAETKTGGMPAINIGIKAR